MVNRCRCPSDAVYEACRQPLKALEASKAGGDWRTAVTLAQRPPLSYSREQMASLAHDLSAVLIANAQFVEAAHVLVDYAGGADVLEQVHPRSFTFPFSLC